MRMGIQEMRRRWPNMSAIDVLYKTPTGSYVELSTELPKALGEEIMKKLIDHTTSKPPGAPVEDRPMTAEEKAATAGRNLRGRRLLRAPQKRSPKKGVRLNKKAKKAKSVRR